MLNTPIFKSVLILGTVMSAAAGSASVAFRPPSSYRAGTNPIAVAAGDFNADGTPDLAVVNAGDPHVNDPGGISVFLGKGDGTFGSAMNFNTGNNPGSCVTGDFNGDGKDDIAVERTGNGGSDLGDVTIFLSNGDGTFSKGQVITSATSPTAIAARDFDSDGTIDLAIFKGGSSLVFVLLGNGDGTFGGPKSYSTSPLMIANKLEVFDVDGDGHADIEVSGLGGGAVLIGNGTGTFQTAVPLSSSPGITHVEFVADFNNDGSIDAILTHCTIGGFPPTTHCGEQVMLNNGTGMVSPVPAGTLPAQTTIAGDFDGDGNIDVAGTSATGSLEVSPGNGDGTFQQVVTVQGPATLGAVVLAADLDGDMARDLVTVNTDNTISVLLNVGTDFSLSASPLTPSSINPGQSATSTVSIGLLTLFSNPVALSCSIQPPQAGAACALSATSVTFDATGKASAMLTVTSSSRLAARSDSRGLKTPIFWVPVAGFTFLGAGLCRRPPRRKMLMFLLAFAACAISVPQVGCGGSGGGPKSRTYAITVTGTSGATQHTANLTLNVQ